MEKIPPVFQKAYVEAMNDSGLNPSQHRNQLKWLRYYLDFCRKYHHGPREVESLQPFLHKLSEKGQGPELQKEAGESINLFYKVVAKFPRPGGGGKANSAAAEGWDEQIKKVKQVMKLRQYSPRTLKTYLSWIRQFQAFLSSKSHDLVDQEDAIRFLTHLATERNVVASTQNQAFSALLFLYRFVLKREYDLGDQVVRARRRKYVPVVLSRREIDVLLTELQPPYDLVAKVLYGCGLRLAECLNLRIESFNFDDAILTIHRGKGEKDRTVPLPKTLISELMAHRETVRAIYESDLLSDYAGAFMPRGSSSKWNSRSRDWVWQFFFPAKSLTLVPDEGAYRRYHLHESHFGKRLRSAAKRVKLDKRVTAHTFRHSFASHLLLANYDIRTVQEMMGHSDVRTTMIYTQTVPSRTRKERKSPLDFEMDER